MIMFGSTAVEQPEAKRHGNTVIEKLHVSISHAIPGRLRLRVTELKQHAELAKQLESRLGSLNGLQSLEVNPRSGSVVFHYEPIGEASFLASLRDVWPDLGDWTPPNREPTSPSAGPYRPDIAGEIAKLCGRFNAGVEKATGGIDLKVLVPVTLVFLSALGLIVAAIRRRRLPAPTWYDMLWFAFNTFVILNLTLSKPKDSDPPDENRKGEAEAS
jgi:hypothetical protein